MTHDELLKKIRENCIKPGQDWMIVGNTYTLTQNGNGNFTPENGASESSSSHSKVFINPTDAELAAFFGIAYP